MKKRFIILASLISLLSLLLLYLVSVLMIVNENKNKAKEEINIYLEVAASYFDGTNFEETSNIMLGYDDRLRLTFIDLDGKVIYDSTLKYSIENLDNHLNRPEIENPGEVIIRKSDNTKDDMMYISTIDHNIYLRLAFNTSYFTTSTTLYVVVALIAIIIIFSLSLIILYFLSKRMLKPVDKKINELANIADADIIFKADTIDKLPEIIAALKLLINNKISQIKEENIKNDTIIQAIDECLILIKNDIITLVNQKTLNIFKLEEENIIGKNYIYLSRNSLLLDNITEAIKKRIRKRLTIVIDNKTYDCNIIPFNSSQILISLKDITEREQIEIIKKDFFANASHELKSPLTSIIGYEQMILNGIIEDKEEIKEASLKILKEANRMNQIIIDMLELSNLEFSKTYDLKEENITNLLNDVIKSYQTKINNKNIKLNLNIDNVILNCNKEQLETLFSNLLDNAIKYNKDNGTIDISLNKDYFQIKDSGIGIPKEEQNRVFERFYRVDKAKSKETGGTGLGLAIVKHICEKFGYSINLESKVNEGTTFIIKFDNINII